MKSKNFTIDLTIFLAYPILASLFSFLLNLNVFFSIVIFYGIPSIYLSFKMKDKIKNGIVWAMIGIIPMIILDYVAHLNKTWLVPKTIFPFRLLEFVTLEVIIWIMFAFYFTIMFYEYFLDKHISHKLDNRKLKYLLISILSIFSIFLLFGFPRFLYIQYFYLFFGLIFILIPILFELIMYPRLFTKFLMAQTYFEFFDREIKKND